MSVVNRMLQDIDRRHVSGGVTAGGDAVRSLPPRKMRRRTSRWAGLVVAMTLLLITGWIFRSQLASIWIGKSAPRQEAPNPVTPNQVESGGRATLGTVAVPGAAVSVESAPLPASSAAGAATAPEAIGTAGLPMPPQVAIDALKLSRSITSTTRSDGIVHLNSSATLVSKEQGSSAINSRKPSPSSPAMTNAAVPPSVLPPVAAGSTTVTTQAAPKRQVAADETLRSARLLWNDGARPAALATLREALIFAEGAKENESTAALSKELARLEIADGKFESGLDILRKYESFFVADADAWALKGNAEQRVSMHEDAVKSYARALALRPSEGKWMIASAISLAAVGRIDEAKVWVARARDRGAVTAQIASYLQQLGIGVEAPMLDAKR